MPLVIPPTASAPLVITPLASRPRVITPAHELRAQVAVLREQPLVITPLPLVLVQQGAELLLQPVDIAWLGLGSG